MFYSLIFHQKKHSSAFKYSAIFQHLTASSQTNLYPIPHFTQGLRLDHGPNHTEGTSSLQALAIVVVAVQIRQTSSNFPTVTIPLFHGRQIRPMVHPGKQHQQEPNLVTQDGGCFPHGARTRTANIGLAFKCLDLRKFRSMYNVHSRPADGT